MSKPIVIIGGMGPQASLRFHELLIEKSKRYHAGDNNQFPYIVHFSVPVADFISDETQAVRAEETLNNLDHMVTELQPSTIALACNTAHLLVPRTKPLQQPQFLSMLNSVAGKLAARGMHTVGLLASPTTVRTKLYEDLLSNCGIATILPNKSQQQTLEEAIRGVVAGKRDAKMQTRLSLIVDAMASEGAEAIVLGCTELPLVFPKKHQQLPVFDCLDIYADAVIERYYLYNEV